MRAPCKPDDGGGPYSRKELLRMDSDFVAAMEAAIERVLERSPHGGPASGIASFGSLILTVEKPRRSCVRHST